MTPLPPPATSNNATTTQSSSPTASNLSQPHKKSSIAGASFNLINSIVGAGIIGIPYALRMSGLLAGVLLLLLVATLTDKSLRLLIELASFHPRLRSRSNGVISTYEELASIPFGRAGSRFVLLNMFLMAFGAMVAYLLIIKDTVPTVLGYDHGTHLLERNLIVIITSLIIIVPLSMQRDMASLSCTSALSVLADVILVGFVVAYSPIRSSVQDQGGLVKVLREDGVHLSSLFVGLGILSTAMACQHSAFIVANSLENKTRRRWRIVSNQSIGLSALLCMMLGVGGYLGFLDETLGDVLNNFPLDSMQADTARLLLAFTMFLTYPMESFVARHVLVMLIHGGDMDAHVKNDNDFEELESSNGCGKNTKKTNPDVANDKELSRPIVEGGGFLCLNRRQSWTMAVYVMTLLPALIFTDIGPILSLTGAIAGSCISFIGPGLIYLGVNGEEFLGKVNNWIEKWRENKRNTLTTDKNDSSSTFIVADQDLPVEGDASLTLSEDFLNCDTYGSISSGSKPFWYYFGLFPIWCSIANEGAVHMKHKIDNFNAAQGQDSSSDGSASGDTVDMLLPPSIADFCVSIFFISFGVLSAVAGVASNVYLQWNK